MSIVQTDRTAAARPLRLWPVLAIVALQWTALLVLRLLDLEGGVLPLMGGGALILLWWLLASRARWIERLVVIVVAVVAAIIVSRVVDGSISTGAQGYLAFVLQLPFITYALVAGALVTSRWPPARRMPALCAFVAIGACALLLLRTDGVRGGGFDLAWRWTATAEQRLLARGDEAVAPAPAEAAAPPVAAPATSEPVSPAPTPIPAAIMSSGGAAVPESAPLRVAWSGFRGSERDSRAAGVRIDTDWAASPPVEIWRKPIGPGWSSFAVAGGLIFTQEQRGADEVVSAYRLDNGAAVWRHRDAARFFEGNAGPGPRSTPTVHNGRVYSMGATGIVNALDARTGTRVWTRNAETDTGAPRPQWGFTASPAVVDDVLVVAASGRLIAYALANGEPRWQRTTGGGGYSSPHLATIDGVRQVVFLSGGGITSVAPADGTVLWQSRPAEGGSILQPAFAAPDDVLIAHGDMMGGAGIRRVHLRRTSGTWTVEDRWTTRGLKPYFSDYVVHEGHAYGFDGTILSCINLESGERTWKGGRYGSGQMVLLPEQDLLLVTSEDGEVVLVSATPDQHREIARFKAVEGKTWNHPVVVGDVLLVRNGVEMAAFRLRKEQ